MQVACNSNVTMCLQFSHRLHNLHIMAYSHDVQIHPSHITLGVLIALSQDPWHRFHNDHKDALIKTGCWLVILERTVVFNCTSAPWSDHGFFCQIREAAEEYFSRSWRCPLYALLYEDFLMLLFSLVVLAVGFVVCLWIKGPGFYYGMMLFNMVSLGDDP